MDALTGVVGDARGFVRFVGLGCFDNALSVMMDGEMGERWETLGPKQDRVYLVGIVSSNSNVVPR